MPSDSKNSRRQRATVEATPEETPKPKPRGWRGPIALAAFLALLWFLPGIVANTPIASWGVRSVTADLKGSVQIEGLSLGWFSPVVVQGVEVRDIENKPVLSLASVTGDRTLFSLLCDYTNLGTFRLDGLKLQAVLREGGNNVEDLLSNYLTVGQPATAPSASKNWRVAVTVVNGEMTITDERLSQTWQLNDIMAGVDMLQGISGPMKAVGSLAVSDGRQSSKISVAYDSTAEGGKASCDVADLPLGMLRGLLERYSPGTTCEGQLTCKLEAAWTAGQGNLQADMHAKSLAVASPAINNDSVRLEQLQTFCTASWQGTSANIERLVLECDVGNASLTSVLQWKETGGVSVDSLLQQQHKLTAQVDLARLARLLPKTLRLQKEVEIKSGQVQLAATSQPDQQGMKWHAQLDMANLTATNAGKPVAWQRPLLVVADAHQTQQDIVVDALRCESDFLKIHASGAKEDLNASLSVNLKQLCDQLGQYVDLGGVEFAGEGSGNLSWKCASQAFDLSGECHLNGLQLTMADKTSWSENAVDMSLAAKGQTDMSVQTRVDSASIGLKTAGDKLDLRIVQPVQNLRNGGVWPFHMQGEGQLQNWPARLIAWLVSSDYRVAGAFAMDADGTASAEGLTLQQTRAAIAPLIVMSPSVNLNEPQIDFAAAGGWNQTQRRLQIDSASLSCATLAAQANSILMAMPASGPVEAAGTLKYQGDLGRITAWFVDPQKLRIAGQLAGQAQIRQAEGAIRGETTTDITNFAVVDSSGRQFQEPRVRLAANASYSNADGLVQVDQFNITSDILNTKIAARFAPVSGIYNAQIDGQLGYDLERLAILLRPYLGSGVRMKGRNTVPLVYRGPFDMAVAQANTALRWDGADIYGLQFGPGELKASMADGLLQIAPLDMTVNSGQMHLAPTVRLASDPKELSMPAGPLVQQIQIDPILCASMLKYIAPILADVAVAQGNFSITLGDPQGQRPPCRIPFDAPTAKGEVTGQFVVHSVEASPGPLVEAIATLMQRRLGTVQLKANSTIQFQMVGGRVYHQGLEMVFPEFTVKTYGSVGIADQSLALMAEMPIPSKWIEKNPAAAQALQGQILRIPVSGTLTKPQLDQRVIEDLTRKFLQKAAENAIQGEMNKQLDRLFGPKN